jgi:hypothetical protein
MAAGGIGRAAISGMPITGDGSFRAPERRQKKKSGPSPLFLFSILLVTVSTLTRGKLLDADIGIAIPAKGIDPTVTVVFSLHGAEIVFVAATKTGADTATDAIAETTDTNRERGRAGDLLLGPFGIVLAGHFAILLRHAPRLNQLIDLGTLPSGEVGIDVGWWCAGATR